MIGCAGMISAVAFVFGVVGSLFAKNANVGERLMIAVVTAAITFFAALFLFAKDHSRQTSTVRCLRRSLLARPDFDGLESATPLTECEQVLISQVRQAIAEFLNVPVQKIRPTDNLQGDLQFDALEPGFHSFVVYHVLAARSLDPQPFTFNTAGLTTVVDLALEVQRVLDSFATATHEKGVRNV